MNNYLDLQDIDCTLTCRLMLEPVGNPEVSVIIDKNYAGGKLYKPVVIETSLDLLSKFFVQIELKNKTYSDAGETAVIIKSFQIDGIDLIPRFDYLAKYVNDHDSNDPTSYLGFNGKWTLTFDRPFYQWLHQVTGQGWLLG